MTKDEIKVYPIIIHYDPSDSVPYEVRIPDLDGITEGYSVEDSMMMAKDYIGTYSLAKTLPPSNYTLPQIDNKKDIVTLIRVNVSEYQRKNDNKIVKKTLTIPNYLNELGKENNINFSEVLVNALKEKLNV